MKHSLVSPSTLDPLASLASTIEGLWTHLAPKGKPETRKRILFTAPGPGQGTTTLACCAALGLARYLKGSVALVEVGGQSDALAKLLGIEARPGFSEALAGEIDPKSGIRPCNTPGLMVMPAGNGALRPGALAEEAARELLNWLSQGRDFVIIDTPPFHLHPELQPLLRSVHQAVVVVESGRARKDETQALIRTLKEGDVEVLGCDLNRFSSDLPAWIQGTRRR